MAGFSLPGQLILRELVYTEDTASLGSVLYFLTCFPCTIHWPCPIQHILPPSSEELSGAHSTSCAGGPCSQHCLVGDCGEACSPFGLPLSVIPSQPLGEQTTHLLARPACLWSPVQPSGHGLFVRGFLCTAPVLCRFF